MIVVDSSCILAILQNESERSAFEQILSGGEHCVISAINAHEAACVMRGRYGVGGLDRLWEFLAAAEIEIVAFDASQARAAASAFDRYGKGVDPRARLNLCDCAAYALAKTMNAPLLFKGDDFPHTDIETALPRSNPA